MKTKTKTKTLSSDKPIGRTHHGLPRALTLIVRIPVTSGYFADLFTCVCTSWLWIQWE